MEDSSATNDMATCLLAAPAATACCFDSEPAKATKTYGNSKWIDVKCCSKGCCLGATAAAAAAVSRDRCCCCAAAYAGGVDGD
jgi:hypothetical protein